MREAICGFHRKFSTGMSDELLQPDNIIVSDGSKMLIYLIQAVCDAGKIPRYTMHVTKIVQISIPLRQHD